jgi:hypothetical protein
MAALQSLYSGDAVKARKTRGKIRMAMKRGFKYYEKFIRGSSLHLLHSLHSIIID